jgi:hypothetical protein
MGVSVDYGNLLSEIQMEQDEIDHIVYLIRALPPNGLMVEWGAGGSTCKWLETLTETQKLITIEHDALWYARVTTAIETHFGDVSERFACLHYPEGPEIKHVYGTMNEEHPIGLKRYFNPEALDIFNADIFVIDGIARATCALLVLLKYTKPNPVILIHDYYGREQWYDWIAQFTRISKVGTTLARVYPK